MDLELVALTTRADEFLEAARILIEGDRASIGGQISPKRFLIGHALELTFKVLVYSEGEAGVATLEAGKANVDINRVRERRWHTHDLIELLSACETVRPTYARCAIIDNLRSSLGEVERAKHPSDQDLWRSWELGLRQLNQEFNRPYLLRYPDGNSGYKRYTGPGYMYSGARALNQAMVDELRGPGKVEKGLKPS